MYELYLKIDYKKKISISELIDIGFVKDHGSILSALYFTKPR